MPWSAIASIAAPVVGGLLASKRQKKGAQQQLEQQKVATAQQMQFQERMSNTAYQRGMADMRKAGLNPILAGKLGGASTPAGATYQPQNIGAQSNQGLLAGLNMLQTVYQTEKMKAEASTADTLAKLNKMDLDYLADKPYGPMGLKYTAINQLSTDIYDEFRDPLLDIIGMWKDPVGTGKQLFGKILNITQNPENRKLVTDTIKKSPKLLKMHPHYQIYKLIKDNVGKFIR